MGKVLKDLGCHDKELSILFTDDNEIARLNNQYLGRKGPTNVLAFPMTGGPGTDMSTAMLGDVVISVDTAAREAAETGETLQGTIDRLLIHGLLHLLGYDHETSPSGARTMEEEEKRLLATIKED